ncbi:DUF1194 domain-containing protein [Pseudohalocynthiibacter sp. F2068]|uniref:DUF1194 domain-containing protein n=1 Tax=Pseudohalocynthiibacter sp. F2068 TaxID=2926418 RepID=UPI001FF4E9AE|nr:DUF1194 domain-containing protein [Pseudohalocynthiibacter sp. F2068]MCK0101532.1 DUF1194 domain-containing protein [Pseudohalocynthiibacter sp. F2068]
MASVSISTLGLVFLPLKAMSCGLALLLAIDVSLSIDSVEYDLQTSGMARALYQEDVQLVIGASPGGVAIAVIQWSGGEEQFLALPWTLFSGPAEIDRFASNIATMPRAFNGDTAPGSALEFGIDLHNANPRHCLRRVIDLSGDGSQKSGVDTGAASYAAAHSGVTVNGLAILGSDRNVEQFFLRNVVRGPNSFLEITNGFNDFERVFHKKLLRELPIILGGLLCSL